MAAILPHLELEDETTELQEKYWECTRAASQGLGALDPLCPTPRSVINQSHAALLNVAYTRQAVIEQLAGRVITPVYSGEQLALQIDKPIEGPLWNPMASAVEVSKLLSWTTKMGAPSFSLPAGAFAMGGSCPGARAGQSIVPDADRRKAARVLLPVLDAPNVNVSLAICEFCYAEGGQYATGSVQFHQIIRYAWVQKALREDAQGNRVPAGSEENSLFVQLMIKAIEKADFKIKGAKGVEPEAKHWKNERFFRLHDSGDFFSFSYLRAWKAIANHFHPDNNKNPITFWAPSRIWAGGKIAVKTVSEINGPAEEANLILRPSGYHLNQPGPPRTEKIWSGWYAGTVVYSHEAQEEPSENYDWNCLAYAAKNGPSCRGAEDPDGRTGCRVCWKNPEMRVNYTYH